MILTISFSFLNNEAYADLFLDYETGEETEWNSSHEIYSPQWKIQSDDSGITIEICIDNARICKSFYTKDCISWDIKDFDLLNWYWGYKPEVRVSSELYEIPPDCNNITITLLDSEYKDFPNYRLGAIPDNIDGGIRTMDMKSIEIKPYKGFFPESLTEFRLFSTDVLVKTAPIQYNYEEKTVRAYTRIKYRIDYQFAGVEETLAESASPEYYNLQGIRIESPRKGELCIERKGNSARKIIY